MSHLAFDTRRRAQLVAACLALFCSYTSGAEAKCKAGMALSPGDHTYNIDFEGKSRTFIVHVPPKYDGRTPVPVVFDLHGFSSSGPGQLGVSGFKAVADMNNFIVVAPTGYMNSWNGDIAFGAAYEAKLNDVGLMKEIVKYVAGIANINRGKVYSTGLSNGAAMSNTLGCQAADTFAGVAPVADPLDIGLATCKPAQPISVLGFHGYSDEYVPYEGGAGSGPRLPTPFPSIADTLKAWGMVMGCTGTPEVVMFTGRNKCEIYRDCGGDAQVGYCSLEGGHVLYSQNALNIADYAWKFFDKFSLPLPDADGDKINDEDDNCPSVANPDQKDANGNCVGDACECMTAADCDDKMFCNGTETCTSGACGPGMPPCQASQQCDESAKMCGDASTKPDAGATKAGAGGSTPSAAAGMPAATAGKPAAAGSSSPSTSTPSGNVGQSGGNAITGASGNTSPTTAPPAAPTAKRSGGCSTPGVSGPQRAWPWLLVTAALATRQRRRRRELATRNSNAT
ncbi:MAG TPA: MYXO-CTERM sorting domain-containing protein [Polyangiales bacterium]|nr:MYXO-CTERM sorting domain-containing protein [Polyangiales bacterium]